MQDTQEKLCTQHNISAAVDIGQGLAYGCVTHVPLGVAYPDFVTPICLGEAQTVGAFNLRDLAPEWVPYHNVLGGSAGTFALKNYVLQRPQTTRVGICQYRKFVSHRKIGVPSANYQVMDVLTPEQLLKYDLNELMQAPAGPFLMGQPGSFTVNGVSYDYLYQYKDVHHVEDFLRFTAAAVELGVLDKGEVQALFNEKIFMPGGIELGLFPAPFWLKGVTDLENVVRFCVQRYPRARSGSQMRSWSFCMERLGSYMLLKHIRMQGLQGAFGYLNLITQEPQLNYVPGA